MSPIIRIRARSWCFVVCGLAAACGGGRDGGADAPPTTGDASGSPDAPESGPAAPTGLHAAAANGHAWVRWDEVAGASYEVLRADAAAGPYALVGSPSTAWFDEGGLTDGATYFYAVRVVAGQRTAPAEVTPRAEPEICVIDGDHDQIFAVTPTVPLLRLAGSLTFFDSPYGVAIDPDHDEIVVGNSGLGLGFAAASLTVFPRTASGNRTPLRRIAGPHTHLDTVAAVAVDPAHDELFITERFASDLTVFARDADGDVAPLRTLGGPATGLTSPGPIAIDPAADQLYVADYGAIRVFARAAAGDTAPVRVIADPGLGTVYGLALVPAHGELLALTGDGLRAYPLTASGPTAPLRTLTASGAGSGLAYDPARDLVSFTRRRFQNPSYVYEIAVHRRTDAGSSAPLRSIPVAGLGVTFDATRDELVATTEDDYVTAEAAVRAFAGGTGAPVRVLSGAGAGLLAPIDLAYDPAAGELWASNIDRGYSLAAFARAAFGPTSARRTIAGDATGLDDAALIAVDPAHGEVFAGSPYGTRIEVFARTAAGDLAPLRTITGVTDLVSLAVDPANDELVVWTPGLVRVVARTATGAITATRELTVPSSLRGELLVDATHDELVLADDHTVRVYDRVASGTTPAPLRSFTAPAVNGIRDLALDGEEIIAMTEHEIFWLPRTADGATAPTRSIAIPTGMAAKAIAVCTP